MNGGNYEIIGKKLRNVTAGVCETEQSNKFTVQ